MALCGEVNCGARTRLAPAPHYIGSVKPQRLLFSTLAASLFLHAADLKPETAAAFDRYVKLTEAAMQERSTPQNFLWLDQHPKEKTLAWMSQSFVIPQETLDHGEKIDVPDGSVQHWLGVTYLETATLDRVRDMLLYYANYKNFFKQQVTDSKLVKREDQRFDASLRLHKKQITQFALNVNLTADYKILDPQHASIASRSTGITVVPHPGKKDTAGKEPSAGAETGYLWRLNIYWRLEQTDVGVFVELETLSLLPASSTLRPGRYLNGFQSFPRELTGAFMQGLETAFPGLHK